MKLFDLSYQLAYYKAYHLHPHNVNIHLYCIPLILATAIVMLMKLPILAWSMALVYSLYYLVLNIQAGIVGTAYITSIASISGYLYKTSNPTTVFYSALIIHIVAWGLQFYGHFHFEKKSPAVFDNLIQPLVLAPYFVIFEVFFLFGWFPALEKNMMNQAHELRKSLDKK
jgi:uncharacterized membrane protein YGL010W